MTNQEKKTYPTELKPTFFFNFDTKISNVLNKNKQKKM